MLPPVAEPSAADIRAWAWQSPEEARDGKTPDRGWWNDNDRFPSALRSLNDHLERRDWRGWQIIADTRAGQEVVFRRPAGQNAMPQTMPGQPQADTGHTLAGSGSTSSSKAEAQ